jgi:hypothetical protein
MSDSDKRSQPRLTELDQAAGSPEILDWDACIETAPPRPSGKVKVRLHFRGRGKPIPMEMPDENAAPKKVT